LVRRLHNSTHDYQYRSMHEDDSEEYSFWVVSWSGQCQAVFSQGADGASTANSLYIWEWNVATTLCVTLLPCVLYIKEGFDAVEEVSATRYIQEPGEYLDPCSSYPRLRFWRSRVSEDGSYRYAGACRTIPQGSGEKACTNSQNNNRISLLKRYDGSKDYGLCLPQMNGSFRAFLEAASSGSGSATLPENF